MARFDVYRGVGGADILLDCESDLLGDLNTRFVMPLLRPENAPQPARRLNPIFEVEGQQYVMATRFAAAIGRRDRSGRLASLAPEDGKIINALDFLTRGY